MNRAIWLLFLSRVREKKIADHFIHVIRCRVNRSWNWLIRRRPSEGTHNFISMDPTASKSPAVGSQKTMRCHLPWRPYWLILAASRERERTRAEEGSGGQTMTHSPGSQCNLYQVYTDVRLLFRKDACHERDDVLFLYCVTANQTIN